MAAKSTTGKRDIEEMFVTARRRFSELIEVNAHCSADLALAKRRLTDAQNALFLYEANSVLDGTINDGANERERKYLLAQWKNDDTMFIELEIEASRCETEVENLARTMEGTRFLISAVKRDMEFAIAWMHAIAGAA